MQYERDADTYTITDYPYFCASTRLLILKMVVLRIKGGIILMKKPNLGNTSNKCIVLPKLFPILL